MQFLRILTTCLVLAIAGVASAGSSQGLTYQGRILRSASEPMNSGTAVFTIKILDANNNCTLWQETQSVPMTDSLGSFAVNIGTGANTAAGALTLSQVFMNAGTLSGLTCVSGSTYTPSATHDRNLSVSFVDSETGTSVAMSATPMAIKAAPFALQADQVSGYGIMNLAKISGLGSANTMTGTQFDFLTNLAAAASVTSTPCGVNEVLKFAGGLWGCAPVVAGTASTSTLTAATSTNSIDNANFAQTWNWTTSTTQSPLSIAADAITTGSLMNLTTSSAAVNSTNGLLNVANTGAGTTGTLARFQSNSTAGSGLTILANGNVGIGTSSLAAGGGLTIAPAASTSGSPSLLSVVGPAHTTLAVGTEATDVSFNLNRTVEFTTGAGITNQRAVRIQAPTYAMTAMQNIFNASTLELSGPPAKGTNTILISTYGLKIAAGAVGAANSAYGLYVDSPTGATNNYAAVFNTGNVGIGTTAPTSVLDINGALTERGISAATAGLSPAGQGRIYFDSTSNTFKASQNGGAYVDLVGGAASSVAASAGTAGSPSVSFSGDADTGFYSKAANTIGISVGTSNVFDISSLGMVSTTTGGANITTAAGTAAAPTYSFAGDAGTGWWRPAASEMAASTGGVERMRIDSNGNLGIATTPVANQRITVSETSTATSGSIYQYRGSLVANPGAASTAGYTGIRMSTGHNAGFSGGSLQGFYNQVYKNNGGISITAMTGTTVDSQLNDGTATTVIGTKNDLTSSFGVATTVTAAENSVTYSTGATTMYGTKSSITQNAGTTATAYGNYSTVIKTAGTITDSYGVYIDSVQGTNKWSLYSNDSAAPSYFAGNVGIGVTGPTAKLQVDGTNAITGSFSNTGTNNPSSAISASASGAALANVGGSFAAIGGTSNKAIEISLTPAAANNYAIYSSSAAQSFFSGSIGIGTTTPGKLLHVRGDQATGMAKIERTTTTGTNIPYGNLQLKSTTTQNMVDGFGSSLGFYLEDSAAVENYVGDISVVRAGADNTADFVFRPAVAGTITERMRIMSNGNVGIGATSPTATLDVKGHVANTGTTATIGTCGTGPAISGNDTRGTITLGTGSPTACTISFASAFATSPICVVSPVGGDPGAIRWWAVPSTTTLVVNFSATPTVSQQFAYNCMQ